jgi:hypothetical protein
MVVKYPNIHKIFQMALKYINIFQSEAHQIFPNWDFWFENEPSGNPGVHPTFAKISLGAFLWFYVKGLTGLAFGFTGFVSALPVFRRFPIAVNCACRKGKLKRTEMELLSIRFDSGRSCHANTFQRKSFFF